MHLGVAKMRSCDFFCILSLIAAVCLFSSGEQASGDEFQPVTPRPLQRLSGWLRASGPTYPQYAPVAAATVFQPGGQPDGDHSAWFGHSMGVPTYNWGYFGVKARPYTVDQGSYYNDHVGWSFRRGY